VNSLGIICTEGKKIIGLMIIIMKSDRFRISDLTNASLYVNIRSKRIIGGGLGFLTAAWTVIYISFFA